MKFIKVFLSLILVVSLTSNSFIVEAKAKDNQELETVYATAEN